ncbi:hypothetical protein KBX73_11795 [Acetobacter persici]|uniref:Rid family hydrolase n=1 Tax=Acetobacter persici TaxID=1076596 RepID=UPI0020CD6F76|nr:Rid family hydrolase [Acetobacter persici]MCP9320443.1 hypothetical protein [Acetobacter persici]
MFVTKEKFAVHTGTALCFAVMGNIVQNSAGHRSGQHARVDRTAGGIRISGLCAPRPEGETIAEQCRTALEAGASLLADYGYSMQDVTRVTYLVSDTRDFPSCFPTLRHVFSSISPSVTLMWVRKFSNPHVKIEFELGVEPDQA